MYRVYVHLLTAEHHMSQTSDHGLKLESRSVHNPKQHLPPPYMGFGPISKRHETGSITLTCGLGYVPQS